jgi:hypothetical protein
VKLKATHKKRPKDSSFKPKGTSQENKSIVKNELLFYKDIICSCGGWCPKCVKTPFFQPKLELNQTEDIFEIEANLIADEVTPISETIKPYQFKSEKDKKIKKKLPITKIPFREWKTQEFNKEYTEKEEFVNQNLKISPNLEEEILSLREGGRLLSQSERAFFEPRFGYDFSNVKLHTNYQAGCLTHELNAKAFTIGQDIFWGKGISVPGTVLGNHLLAHELTHVIQQQSALPITDDKGGLSISEARNKSVNLIQLSRKSRKKRRKKKPSMKEIIRIRSTFLDPKEMINAYTDKGGKIDRAELAEQLYWQYDISMVNSVLNLLPMKERNLVLDLLFESIQEKDIGEVKRILSSREELFITESHIDRVIEFLTDEYDPGMIKSCIKYMELFHGEIRFIFHKKISNLIADRKSTDFVDKLLLVWIIREIEQGMETYEEEKIEKQEEPGFIPEFLYKSGVDLMLQRIERGELELSRGPILTPEQANEVVQGVYESTKGAIPLAKGVAHLTMIVFGGMGSASGVLAGMVAKKIGLEGSKILYPILEKVVVDSIKGIANITIEELAKEAGSELSLTERVFNRIREKFFEHYELSLTEMSLKALQIAFGETTSEIAQKFDKEVVGVVFKMIMDEAYAQGTNPDNIEKARKFFADKPVKKPVSP